MYKVGELVIYGSEGVCRVKEIGRLSLDYARKDVDYYTLDPLYREGVVFAPVDTKVIMRPIMTREEAEKLIACIPEVSAEVYEERNPRLLDEHYQAYLKSCDSMDQVKLIRSLYAKKQRSAAKGRGPSQVDERCMKRAEGQLHGELAAALGIPIDSVRDYISQSLKAQETEDRQ